MHPAKKKLNKRISQDGLSYIHVDVSSIFRGVQRAVFYFWKIRYLLVDVVFVWVDATNSNVCRCFWLMCVWSPIRLDRSFSSSSSDSRNPELWWTSHKESEMTRSISAWISHTPHGLDNYATRREGATTASSSSSKNDHIWVSSRCYRPRDHPIPSHPIPSRPYAKTSWRRLSSVHPVAEYVCEYEFVSLHMQVRSYSSSSVHTY